ncbi:Bone/cartilage proteoglycan I [Intoshia linei]|uniref:Bone/cartilage proteoglycan I n=1 Tax=Intoshia linei TaxID=1819745 RepID=A0A177AZE4_9BILA|nr:Bone/cartilage proteoglycan I [Intoshia linei]
MKVKVFVEKLIDGIQVNSTKRASFGKVNITLENVKNESVYYFNVVTLKKDTFNFKLRNLTKLFTRFIDKGKLTIEFSSGNITNRVLIDSDASELKLFVESIEKSINLEKFEPLKKKFKCDKIDINTKYSKLTLSIEPSNIMTFLHNSNKYNFLETLRLEGCNMFTVYTQILQLNTLSTLSLSKNKLKTFDSNCLKSLQNLYSLDLSHNVIESIQISDGNNFSNVNVLLLNNNKIVLLSNNFFEFYRNLKELYLENNKLEKIPTNISIVNLKILRISDNRIKYVAPSMLKLSMDEFCGFNNIWHENKKKYIKLSSLFELSFTKLIRMAKFTYNYRDMKNTMNLFEPNFFFKYLSHIRMCKCGNYQLSKSYNISHVSAGIISTSIVYVSDENYISVLYGICSKNCT